MAKEKFEVARLALTHDNVVTVRFALVGAALAVLAWVAARFGGRRRTT